MNVRFRIKGNDVEIFCCTSKELIARPQLSLTPRVVIPGGIIGCILRKTRYRIILRLRRKERRKAYRISVSDIISDITPTTLRYHERNQQGMYFNKYNALRYKRHELSKVNKNKNFIFITSKTLSQNGTAFFASYKSRSRISFKYLET